MTFGSHGTDILTITENTFVTHQARQVHWKKRGSEATY